MGWRGQMADAPSCSDRSVYVTLHSLQKFVVSKRLSEGKLDIHELACGGYTYNGDAGEFRIALLLVAEIPPFHTRHHEIKDDQPRWRRGVEIVKGRPRAVYSDHLIPFVTQDICQGLTRALIIVHNENLLGRRSYRHDQLLLCAESTLPVPAPVAGCGTRGSSTENVDPSPTVLSTDIWPPIASTTSRVIHSPSPKPPYCRPDTPRAKRWNSFRWLSASIPP